MLGEVRRQGELPRGLHNTHKVLFVYTPYIVSLSPLLTLQKGIIIPSQRSWGIYWIQRVPPFVFCFPDIFWINFADNEMKLGMIIYNNELQIKFEFCCY
jgi:hypothetical protein